MNGESIREMLRAQPFAPFEVHLSGGEVHRVTHPELAWVAGSEFYVFYPEGDRVARCSLLHVTSLEHSQRPMQKKKGGK
jgi:hypothetical protein